MYMMNLFLVIVLIFVFNRYGFVISVRILLEKFCVFVNFKIKEVVGKVM